MIKRGWLPSGQTADFLCCDWFRRCANRGAWVGECSAGACPPLGSGWGVAESAVPIRCTKPQLRLFIPWCAGGSRHGRLVRKHVPDSDPGCALQSTSMPAFHRRNVPNCKPMVDGGMSKCSAGACPPLGSGWGVAESAVPIRCTKTQLRLFIPWCAGSSRHGRLVRKHVPDSDPGSIPAPAGDTNHRRPNNDSPGSQERNVALGLVPS